MAEATLTMLAAIATLLCALALDPAPAVGVLAVVLCVSLSRSQLDRDRRGRIEAAFVLPVVGVAASGVGFLLQHMPVAGAAVFTTGMFVSIWLRRFGPMARRAGALVGLPFVALLIVPHIAPREHPNALWAACLPILVALLALLWVTVFHAIGRRLDMLPAGGGRMPVLVSQQTSSLRPIPSTRMAIQMATALALSFAVGHVFFPAHGSWVVLTAFIVNSGSRGRLDVAYKSVLRLVGAAAGTLLALTIGLHAGTHHAAMAVAILVALFVGIWLRPFGYVWWALCVTVVFALLQGFAGLPLSALLWPRLESIAIGAVIGVAAAWFVLPVRSRLVLRRRVADALATLAAALDPATPVAADEFLAALTALEQVAPAFRASRRVLRHVMPMQPADWIDTLLACRGPAQRLIERRFTSPEVRRAVGAARKALGEPPALLAALRNVEAALGRAQAQMNATARGAASPELDT
ncbi:FUSC family protein [Trinickia fusca]|uniref:FUSC family protein n=1 Tax=Trinickia fusca TaxID=2419777 RepID=UPI0016037852|nr:FUSC family protein [Trinickia fusca]